MLKLTYLPGFVKVLFKGMPGVWKNRHLLLLYWFVLLQALVPGRKTVKELSGWSPAHITEWRLRRLLKAGYWSAQQVISWFAEEAIKSFPLQKMAWCIWWVTGVRKANAARRILSSKKAEKGSTNRGIWAFDLGC